MRPNAKKSTVYAKVLDRKIVMVEISIHPACSHVNQSSKENKTNSYMWFTAEHFQRLILKLQDVILARVLAPSKTTGKKKVKSDKTSQCDRSEMLPDHELLIQYQFVKKRKYKQTVLVRKKQEPLSEDPRRDLKQSDYSGGGHESYEFFPEKLFVTVNLNSEPGHQKSLVTSGVTEDVQAQQPSQSTISKYFNKETAIVTRSTQKKRAALRNLNKKNDSQEQMESHLCSTSSVVDKLMPTEEENFTAADSTELQVDAQGKHDQISWINQFGKEMEIQDVVSFHEGDSVKGMKQDEHDKNVLKMDGNAENEQSSSENYRNAYGASPKHEDELEATSRSEDSKSSKDLKNNEAVINNKASDSKSTASTSSKLKRRRSFSESDTTDTDSVPSLRSRISKKNTVKKQKAASSDESGGNRKEIASVKDKTGDDNDFETPKVRRNTRKRKGSDLSDDQELFSSVFATNSETSSSAKPNAKDGANSKKRKTKKVEAKGEALERKATNLARKRITRRQAKTANKTTVRNLEDVTEEPGSSPAEPITVEDKPVTLNVSTIEELTASDTEQLVWEYARELREIFEGKKYCRRHEDYKKGGKMKGDLAFQVQFGSFSEEQRDRIMGVLTNMFCYKHSKYFDYVSKVLLPEALVMLYMRVVGKTRNEAERLLLEVPTSAD